MASWGSSSLEGERRGGGGGVVVVCVCVCVWWWVVGGWGWGGGWGGGGGPACATTGHDATDQCLDPALERPPKTRTLRQHARAAAAHPAKKQMQASRPRARQHAAGGREGGGGSLRSSRRPPQVAQLHAQVVRHPQLGQLQVPQLAVRVDSQPLADSERLALRQARGRRAQGCVFVGGWVEGWGRHDSTERKQAHFGGSCSTCTCSLGQLNARAQDEKQSLACTFAGRAAPLPAGAGAGSLCAGAKLTALGTTKYSNLGWEEVASDIVQQKGCRSPSAGTRSRYEAGR